jgi:hypothetical protein
VWTSKWPRRQREERSDHWMRADAQRVAVQSGGFKASIQRDKYLLAP